MSQFHQVVLSALQCSANPLRTRCKRLMWRLSQRFGAKLNSAVETGCEEESPCGSTEGTKHYDGSMNKKNKNKITTQVWAVSSACGRRSTVKQCVSPLQQAVGDMKKLQRRTILFHWLAHDKGMKRNMLGTAARKKKSISKFFLLLKSWRGNIHHLLSSSGSSWRCAGLLICKKTKQKKNPLCIFITDGTLLQKSMKNVLKYFDCQPFVIDMVCLGSSAHV